MRANPSFNDVEMGSSSSSYSGSSSGACLPTKTILIICAIVGAALLILMAVLLGVYLSPYSYSVPQSSPNTLYVLEKTDTIRPNGAPRVVARSYDGLPWEIVPDQDYNPVALQCNGLNCEVNTRGSYRVRQVDVPPELVNVTAQARAARFLIQTTFGPTLAEINSLVSAGSNWTNWLLQQIQLPATSLRQYFRRRSNPRQVAASPYIGATREACEPGARFHRYAFNHLDQFKSLVVSAGGIGFELRVNGQLRGEVASFLAPAFFATLTLPVNVTICETFPEQVGGRLQLSNLTGRCPPSGQTNNWTWTNPAIDFTTAPPGTTQTLTAGQATFANVATKANVVILQSITGCATTGVGAERFIRMSDNTYWRFDPRIKFLTNSVESPVDQPASGSLVCPSVQRTFINFGQCVRRATCSPITFTAANVDLDTTSLRRWFTGSNRYVYWMNGLRLEAPFDISPCTGRSRWRRSSAAPCGASETALDTNTKANLAAALSAAAATDTNPNVVDILLPSTNPNCTRTDRATIGAFVTAGGACFEHVHPDLFNVVDMSYWTLAHDGNEQAFAAQRPNPITRFAELGNVMFSYPGNHVMQNWQDRRQLLPSLGRWGDRIDFRSLRTELQTADFAGFVGATLTGNRTTDGFEACGATGELDNDPTLGHHYQFPDGSPGVNRDQQLDFRHPFDMGTSMVWTNVALLSQDQLRQRMAWALSQIVTLGKGGVERNGENEPFLNYYDIFVRNAFGNYRDILREVSFSPLMGEYLSFIQNRGFAFQQAYPDENFAREIMQLFSIGLWQLNDDGSQRLDGSGNPIATYDNDDVVVFARVWTGFDAQNPRSNVELAFGPGSRNIVDPMQIKPIWRDFLPKAKLDAGYLGDKYPLCSDLPPRHWLTEGARYVFTGRVSAEGTIMDAQNITNSGLRGRFAPVRGQSALYDALCAPATPGGPCTFPTEVVLTTNLACNGVECNAGRVTTVTMVDPVAGVTRYYTYRHAHCVRLAFLENQGRLLRNGGSYQCADPSHPVGFPVCCRSTANTTVLPASNVSGLCLFGNEAVTWDVAKARCEAGGAVLCASTFSTGSSWDRTCAEGQFMWLNGNNFCSHKIQIYQNGQVGLVDLNISTSYRTLLQSSGNSFRVYWQGNSFPTACNVGDCRLVATAFGDTCVCSPQVSSVQVYTDISKLPSAVDIFDTLYIGAPKPSSFGSGVYVQCTSGACASRSDIKIWSLAAEAGTLTANTIFELPAQRAGGRPFYVRNRISTVSVGSFSFRNPPSFMPLAGEMRDTSREWNSDLLWIPRAELEVEALLDHLFEHNNTAVFVAYRLLQRLITSNPTPRYVRRVVDAFRSGTYNGVTYSGKYGDLQATTMAIFLDPEARSPILEADTRFGRLREPLLKVLHLMRSLEYQKRNAKEITTISMSSRIGQDAFYAPSVFGFYLPENRPAGQITDNGLVGPEAELGTAPLVVGYLNGVSSLIDIGLSNCNSGFGNFFDRSCSAPANTSDGVLTFNASTPDAIVDGLDLLLTAGRLNRTLKSYITSVVSTMSAASGATNGPANALKLAQKLVAFSPEFNMNNANILKPDIRQNVADVPGANRRYKAIVVIFQGGGSDSFNMLVPTDCSPRDLNSEYVQIRGLAAVDRALLLPITSSAGQPCTGFGIHPTMPNSKVMYDAGELAFVANVGALVEPVTKADFLKTTGFRVRRFPPSLFAHNIMQRSMHNLDAQNAGAKGILGRLVNRLLVDATPYRSELYSIAGNTKMLEGTKAPDVIDASGGVIRYSQYAAMRNNIGNLTFRASESAFAETYASLLDLSLRKSESIGALLSSTTLNVTFGTDNFSRQMQQVARLIKLRTQLGTERAVFFTSRGGYDTHNTFNLDALFGDIDRGVGALRQELKAQQIWDDVVVLTVSDFGRTLTSNGQGTDHAWGGNHFVAGGRVRGNQILGRYPDSLLDSGSVALGRGRILPTVPWEAMWNGIVDWFGLNPSEKPFVLPNAANFPATDLFTRDQMFR